MRGIVPTALAAAALALVQPAPAAAKCALSANGIQHIVYIQFDNLHFRRDIPNVPSDLEQMPTSSTFWKAVGHC